MNLVFLNAVLAPLLALAAVPVLVHLFARSRPKRVVFSSLRFLEPVVRRNLRMKRPRMWVLLVLRTLAVLALMLAFLLPVLPSILPEVEVGTRRNVVLVVDASASMGALEGARTRFAAATAQGDGILAGLGSGARANIIFARALPSPVFPVLAANLDALRDELRRGRAHAESADIPGALAMAAGMLADAEGTRELFVLSDFQATTWEDVLVPEMPGVERVMVRCAAEAVPNQGLISASVTPRRVLAGGTVEVLCQVANFSTEPVLRTIFLRSGEVAQSRDVRIGPMSTGGAAFEVRFPVAGDHAIELSMDEDAFPVDNRRWLTVESAPHLLAMISGTETAVGRAWLRACNAIEWIETESLDDKDLGSTLARRKPDVLLLADGDGSGAGAVGEFLNAGGLVIVAPAAGADADWLGPMAGVDQSGGTWQPMPEPMGFQVASVDHPALAVFEGGRFGEPAGGRAQGRQRLDAGLEAAFERVVAFEDGVAAIAMARQRDGLILWNVADVGGTWHERSELVPLLGELVSHGAHQSRAGGPAHTRSGRILQRTFETDLLEEDLEVVSRNEAFPVRRVEGRERTFALDRPSAPGVYDWLYQGSRVALDPVNLPGAESDLRVMDQELAGIEGALALDAGESVQALQQASPLWPWLVAFAMLAVCMEGVMAWKFRDSN